MRALIKRTFINRGRRFRKGVHDFPDDAKLPRDAIEVDEKGKPVLKKGQEPTDVNMSVGPELNIGRPNIYDEVRERRAEDEEQGREPRQPTTTADLRTTPSPPDGEDRAKAEADAKVDKAKADEEAKAKAEADKKASKL